ncbi:MAG: hypothetical protein ACRENK_11830 [Gemmatimonadaceae bacterium]
MKNKIFAWSSGIGATIAGLLVTANVHAAAFFTTPTSTASSLTANVGDQLGDAGTLLVIGVAAGIPLAFYVIHQLIGLLPKSRGRRS